jgi:hypothetical protein
VALLALLAMAIGLLISGCRPASGAASSSSTVSTDLAAISVGGPSNAEPDVDVPVPFSADATTTRVLRSGTGPVARRGSGSPSTTSGSTAPTASSSTRPGAGAR